MIFLSAPYSASSESITEQRMIWYCQVAALLLLDGHNVISPLLNHWVRKCGNLDVGGDWEFWQDYSEDLLAVCNALYVIKLPGWDQSIGVKGEIDFAKQRNIPIYEIEPTFENCKIVRISFKGPIYS